MAERAARRNVGTTSGMYGWRARIGLILPADNVLMEPELNALNMPGVSFHGLRLTATEPDEMRRQAIELARGINELGLDAVVYACAETSFNGGTGVRKTLASLIEAECGLPVITATNAMLAAIEQLGVTRVTVVTPYSAPSAATLEETLVEHDLTVVSSLHRDFSLETDDPRVWYLTNRQPATEMYAMARSADHPEAQALLLVSTNIATLQIVDQLERDIRKPVLTSNQCILWWCLRRLGLSSNGLELGRLIRSGEQPGVPAVHLASSGEER